MDDSQWMPPDPHRMAPPPPPAPVLPPAPALAAPAFEGPTVEAAPAFEGPTVEPIGPAESARPRRSKLLVGGGVVAVLAVGVAGVFAVQQYSGAGAGGAASPGELGAELMTAIEHEDVLGMVDTLLPGERDVMRDPLVELVSELTRLDVLSDGADLSSIAGFDVELDGEAVTARGTNVDDIVNVDMRAEATVTVDGSVVPLGELVTDNMEPADVTEMRDTVETSTEDFDVTLTAVEQDGQWYFSLFHTVAEQLRGQSEPMPDVPVEGIGAAGADSPEAAFDQMLDDFVTLDVPGLIRGLNPGEAAALQRYAPLFLDEVDAAIAELPGFQISVDSRDIRVEGDGDTRTVFVDAMALSGSFGDTGDQVRFQVGFEGDCVHASVEGDAIESDEFEECVGSLAAQPELEAALEEAPEVAELVAAVEAAFADIEPVGLELRQYEGGWYVSPMATGTEALLKFLRALDRQEVDQLIELGAASAEQFLDLALGGMLGVDEGWSEYPIDDLSSGQYSSDESYSSDVSFGVDTDPSVAESDERTWERCYEEADADDAVACFQQYIATGEIDEAFIPVALRYPECGYAEVSWSDELYYMSDAEFMAAADAARPCFMALLEAGSIEEYELPYEITRPECFEGRNWYATFDDADYDDRYWACIEAGAEVPATPEPAATAPITTAPVATG
jgi:hypothetical protein